MGCSGDWEYGLDGDELAMTLDVGDNFVVNIEISNNEMVDFWDHLLHQAPS
jgi:hypothetical protein